MKKGANGAIGTTPTLRLTTGVVGSAGWLASLGVPAAPVALGVVAAAAGGAVAPAGGALAADGPAGGALAADGPAGVQAAVAARRSVASTYRTRLVRRAGCGMATTS
jgi:hypothetical protein